MVRTETRLREITGRDVEEAVEIAKLIGHVLGGFYRSTQLGDWAAILLTRPEAEYIVDAEYEEVNCEPPLDVESIEQLLQQGEETTNG